MCIKVIGRHLIKLNNKMSSTRTYVSELPLHYQNERLGQTLVLSFAHNNRGIVKGYYIYAVQSEMGEVLDKGTVKGIDTIDKIRNEYILKGFRILPKKKVVITKPGEQKKKKKEVVVEKVEPPSNPQEDEARKAAFEKMEKMAENDFF